jgi:hypothetical protein
LTNANEYAVVQVDDPEFINCQLLTNLVPGEKLVPSGMVSFMVKTASSIPPDTPEVAVTVGVIGVEVVVGGIGVKVATWVVGVGGTGVALGVSCLISRRRASAV